MARVPTLDQLRVLVAVAETGSFRRAAERLNRVQSAISQAIANLEEDLGVAVFDRTSRPVGLSQQGRAILEDSRLVLEKVQALRLRAESFSLGVETSLTIAFDTIFPRDVLVASVMGMHARYPTVAVRLVSLVPADPIQIVAAGDADLGIGLSQGAGRAVELERLGSVRLFAVAASSHPLARLRNGFPDAELRDHVEIRVTDASRITKPDTTPLQRDSAWRVVDLESNRSLILAGVGWGVLPEHAIYDDLRDKRLVVLVPKSRRPDGANAVPVFMISRADRLQGPALKTLGDGLRAMTRKSMLTRRV